MKLAISNFAWDMQDNEYVYREMQKRNITGLEFAPLKLFGEQPYSKEKTKEAQLYFKKIYEKYGISPVSVQSIWSGLSYQILGSEQERLYLQEHTKRVIAYANTISCPQIMWGSGACRSLKVSNQKTAYARALDFFQPLLIEAQNANVVIAVEAVNEYYKSQFLTNTIECLDFVYQCQHPNLQFNFDTGIMCMEQEKISDFQQWEIALKKCEQSKKEHDSWLDFVHHIHISEPQLVPVKQEEYWKILITEMKENGYEHFLSLEMMDAGLHALVQAMDEFATAFR